MPCIVFNLAPLPDNCLSEFTEFLSFAGPGKTAAKLSYTDMERDGIEVVNSSVDYSLLQGVQAATSNLSLLSVMGVIAAQAGTVCCSKSPQ